MGVFLQPRFLIDCKCSLLCFAGVEQHNINVMLITETKMNISIEGDNEWELETIPSSEKKEKINFKLNNSETSSVNFDEQTLGGRDVEVNICFLVFHLSYDKNIFGENNVGFTC